MGSIRITKKKPEHICIIGCGSFCKSNCGIEIFCIGICGCVGFGCLVSSWCLGVRCGVDNVDGDDGDNSDDGDDGDDDDDEPESLCSVTYMVTDCEVVSSVTDFGILTTRTCYSPSCVTVDACSKTGFTTTSETTSYDCPWITNLIAAAWMPIDLNGLPPLFGAGGEFGYIYIYNGVRCTYAVTPSYCFH